MERVRKRDDVKLIVNVLALANCQRPDVRCCINPVIIVLKNISVQSAENTQGPVL